YFSEWGQARARGICTHVAAVMLYRRYRAQLERLKGAEKLYVCTAEVVCASGRLYAREAAEVEREPLALKATPKGKTLVDWGRFSVVAVSRTPEILICCRERGGSPCRRLRCREAAPGEAAALME
ncbi:MAG: hypothetical protein U7M05_12070, partial [Candidatus Igneacidithiobacillus chanchocoensis]